MDLIIKAQDYLALLMVLISIVTVIEVKKRWAEVWDDNLTAADRLLLMKVAAFVVMPVIVLLHESGHALATLCFGGKIAAFHYGFFIGDVVSDGHFTDFQSLLITLAGNVVQVLSGLIAAFVALRATKPPVVALGVYVFFWSVGGTLVLYAILSVFGMYGDWAAIYTSPVTVAVFVVGSVHLLFLVALIWLAYAEEPRLWFSRKTKPDMVLPERELLNQLAEKKTVENYLELAWFYLKMGINRQAERYVKLIDKLSPSEPGHLLVKGYLLKGAGRLNEALAAFEQCSQNRYAEESLVSQAYVEIGPAKN